MSQDSENALIMNIRFLHCDIILQTNGSNYLFQLDIRTKLCIRDSLYRLARSAEQRHNCANLNENIREDKLVRIAPLIDQDANRQVITHLIIIKLGHFSFLSVTF